MHRHHLTRPALAAALMLACQPNSGTSATDTESVSSSSTGTTGASDQDPSTSTTDGPTTGTTAPAPTTTTSTTDTDTTGDEAVVVTRGLSRPESILYDAEADTYLISNINGDPAGQDDNGFIARVRPDGSVEDLTWIDGAAADIDLDAPKGMAIVGDVLYVTDITVVRKFDRVTGASLGAVEVDGAMFLNDLSADGDGDVYVSDNAAQAIHILAPDDTVTLLFQSTDLQGPNGLVADDSGVYVATFNAAKLLYVPREMPLVMDLADLPGGGLDGLVRAPSGGWYVSSWDADAVFHVSDDFQSTVALADISSAADIGLDSTRNRLLVPVLLEDRAEFHALP